MEELHLGAWVGKAVLSGEKGGENVPLQQISNIN